MTFILWSIYFDHHLPLKPSIGKRRKQSCIPNNISSYLKLRAFAHAFSYGISETTYLCFYFCIRYWRIVRDITIFARSWCIAISPGIELVRVFPNKLCMKFSRMKLTRVLVVLFYYQLVNCDLNPNENIGTRSIIIFGWGSESDALSLQYRGSNIRRTLSRMSRRASSIIRTGFTWLILGRPGTGSLYICKSIGALRLSQLFSLPDIYPFTMIAIRFFGLTLKWFIACYLSAIRCLTYAESPYCRLRLSDATICVLVIGCYTECSPWTRI